MAHYYVDPVSGSDTTGDGLSDGTAWQTLQHALDNITKGTYGDQVNLKSSGADVLTANLDFTTYDPGSSATGAGLDKLVIRGYGSTANDGAFGIIDEDALYRINTLNHTSLIDLEIKNGPGNTDAIQALSNQSRMVNCHVHSCPRSILGYAHGGTAVVNCRFENIANEVCRSHSSSFLNCYFSTGPDYAFTTAIKITTGTVKNCVFNLSGGATAIEGASIGHTVTNNTFYCDSGFGAAYLVTGDDARGSVVAENIIMGFTTGTGIDNQSDYGLVLRNNTFYNNGTDISDPAAGADGYADKTGNETVGSSPIAESGSDTFANRGTFFAPLDVGSVTSDVLPRGAIPTSATISTGYSLHPLAYN